METPFTRLKDAGFAAKTDRIERGRWFYSSGKRVSVVVNNPRDGSLISKYLNAVRRALKSGDESYLDPFREWKITAVDGQIYPFEVDLDTLYELAEQVEEIEFVEIYN